MTLRTFYKREYGAWTNMKGRCKRDKHYVNVEVCADWQNSFEQFFADMGEHPGQGYSLDRIDNKGNYEPSNCRWADWHTQNNNRSNNKPKVNKPPRKTYQQWIDECGVPGLTKETVAHRINRYGWSLEQALTIPLCATRGKGKQAVLRRSKIL